LTTNPTSEFSTSVLTTATPTEPAPFGQSYGQCGRCGIWTTKPGDPAVVLLFIARHFVVDHMLVDRRNEMALPGVAE
jgi:hypothetical protein